MLSIPASVKLNGIRWEVGVGNLLAGVLVAVAVFVQHHRPDVVHLRLDHHKPVCGTDLELPQFTGHFELLELGRWLQ